MILVHVLLMHADSCKLSKSGVSERNLYLNIIYDRKNYITRYLIH